LAHISSIAGPEKLYKIGFLEIPGADLPKIKIP